MLCQVYDVYFLHNIMMLSAWHGQAGLYMHARSSMTLYGRVLVRGTGGVGECGMYLNCGKHER